MSNARRRALAALAGAALAVTVGGVAAMPAQAAPGGGNIACSSIDSRYLELKYDLDQGDLFVGQVISDGTLEVTITEIFRKQDGSGDIAGFSFTADIPVDAVIVKGGSQPAKVYGRYMSATTSYSRLFTPVKGDGTHFGISNVKFCYLKSTMP
jgi:hypothetical protein